MIDTIILDFDDTLVATNILFERARDQFPDEMEELGFHDRRAVAEYSNERDLENVGRIGYLANECFPLALQQTYEHFMTEAGRPVSQSMMQLFWDLGWGVFDLKAEWMPEAEETLQKLQGKARLILFTQGEISTQLARVRRQEVLQYFDAYRITPIKNREAYERLIIDFKIDPASSCMVGNSFRADVNPALSVGLNAVHYHVDAWEFEKEQAKGSYREISRLSQLLELIV